MRPGVCVLSNSPPRASIGQVWTRHLAPAAPASRPSSPSQFHDCSCHADSALQFVPSLLPGWGKSRAASTAPGEGGRLGTWRTPTDPPAHLHQEKIVLRKKMYLRGSKSEADFAHKLVFGLRPTHTAPAAPHRASSWRRLPPLYAAQIHGNSRILTGSFHVRQNESPFDAFE